MHPTFHFVPVSNITTHNSSLTAQKYVSSVLVSKKLTTHNSLLTTRRSPLIARNSPLTARRSLSNIFTFVHKPRFGFKMNKNHLK
jgi:hypothetical protein